MKSIKELELKTALNKEDREYYQALKDILKLIDEIEEHPMSLTRFISELKARIKG